MPRILIVTGEFPEDAEPFILEHVKGMAKRGWQVLVSAEIIHVKNCEYWGRQSGVRIGVHTTRPFVEKYIKGRAFAVCQLIKRFGLGFRAKLKEIKGLNLKLRTAALYDTIEEFQPDLVYAHFATHGMLAATAARQARVPLCVHFHGYDLTRYPQQHGWEPYARVLEGATVIVTSRFAEELITRHLPRLKIRRIRFGGIDRSIFRTTKRSARWPKPVTLLMVGRMVRAKGALVAVQTLALLRARHPELDARLVIVGGGGPLMVTLRRYVQNLGLSEVVELPGWASQLQVADHMAKADVLVVPSQRSAAGDQEVFCYAAVEGIACGLPVIGSNIGGLPETIGNGGRIVRAASASEFADAVAGIVQDGSPDEWGKRAFNSATRFSRKDMIDDYEFIACEAAGL